jgi:hypothetical protein
VAVLSSWRSELTDQSDPHDNNKRRDNLVKKVLVVSVQDRHAPNLPGFFMSLSGAMRRRGNICYEPTPSIHRNHKEEDLTKFVDVETPIDKLSGRIISAWDAELPL